MDDVTANIIGVISYNIRFDNSQDGHNAWPHRKERVADLLRCHAPIVADLQEALKHQIDDLALRLPGYGWIGVGREDGCDAGEFTPIFYDKSRLTLARHGAFWLSQTPDIAGSHDWGTDCIRIVTWAQFVVSGGQEPFFVFNTHFDHFSELARVQSAYLLLAKIGEIAGNRPVIVTGDFNCTQRSQPYHILTQAGGNESPALKDAHHHSEQGHHGPSGTLNPQFAGLIDEKIDYIFVSAGIRVLCHAILTDNWHGRYPSDHLPVLARLTLP